MQFRSHLSWSRFVGSRDGRRVPGRVPQDMLECSLGPILDLSTGGMRLLSTRNLHGKVVARLTVDQLDLKIPCQVAWTKKIGFRRHEIGLTFIDLEDGVSSLLARIATDHRARRAV